MTGPRALQFYYTSCRRGLSGYAGFQTRAETEGLHSSERAELERWGLYRAPRNLPMEPDDGVIAAEFPKAFKTLRLSSGRTAIIRSGYVGQDYSGRWGNYFAHGLVLDGGLGERWPIDLYAWPGWVDRLEEGAGDVDPTPLPEVGLSELAGHGRDHFSFSQLKDFLAKDEARQALLAQMLSAVFLRGQDSRSIVIRDRDGLALSYIACIQKAFPPSYQAELSCSSFQFDPRRTLAVNATSGETDFLFNEAEREYQFYVFDLVDGRPSGVDMEHAEYARTVAEWMASRPERLTGFYQFTKLFDRQEIGAGLLQMLRLYRLDRGERVALSTKEIDDILTFVNEHRPSDFGRVFQAVGDVTASLDDQASFEVWAKVIRFLLEGAAQTGEAEVRRRACRAWVEAFDRFVITTRQREEEVLALRDEMVRDHEVKERDLSRAFVCDTHLDWMWRQVGGLPTDILATVLAEVVRASMQLGRVPVYETLEVRRLVAVVLSYNRPEVGELGWAFEPFRQDAEALASLVEHMVSVVDDAPRLRAVGRALEPVLRGRKHRFAVLMRLAKQGDCYQALVGEWEASLESARDKIKAHEEYERALFGDSEFEKKAGGELPVALFEMLSSRKERARQSDAWMKSGRLKSLPEPLAKTTLELLSERLKLEPEHGASADLAEKIEDALNARKLSPRPRRLQLRAAACRVLQEPHELDGLQELLGRVTPDAYGEFVGLVLPRLLGVKDSPDWHGELVSSMAGGRNGDGFRRIYEKEFLNRRPRDRFEGVDVAATVFWLSCDESKLALSRLKAPAIEGIVRRLRAVKGKARKQADAALKGREELRAGAPKEALKELLERAGAPRRSLWARIFGRRKKL